MTLGFRLSANLRSNISDALHASGRDRIRMPGIENVSLVEVRRTE